MNNSSPSPDPADAPRGKSGSRGRAAKHLRAARRNADRAGRAVLAHIRKFLLDRRNNLRLVRRDMVIWLLLVTALIAAGAAGAWLNMRDLRTTAGVGGGTYAEGVVDKMATINPLFAATDSEKAASGLVYASLLSYDKTNHLRGDLAATWSVSSDGKSWSVKLRPSLVWSDGRPLTADDVVFTVNLIKNSAVGSPLATGWRTVAVAKISASEVKFTLPNAYMSFPFALTFGVLPQHVFQNIAPSELKNAVKLDQTAAVGSGPFTLKAHETLASGQVVWRFAPNGKYYAGAPRLSALTIRTYADNQELTSGLERGEINAAAGLSASAAATAAADRQLTAAPLADGVFVMFNNSAPLTSDKNLREALRLATDRAALRQTAADGGKLAAPTALETPVARGVYASIDELRQPNLDAAAAAKQLDAAGWKLGGDGLRAKNGQTLTLSVVTVKGTDYEPVAQALVKQWRKLGVDAQLTAADPATAQQNYLMPRNYDVLVYQLHLGADPDEFAYWSSAQAVATGLNFANYKSARADLALAAGRTQLNAATREARYGDFAKQWLADAPAIALYQPNYYYASVAPLQTLDGAPLVAAADHFRNVENWTVKTATVNVTP